MSEAVCPETGPEGTRRARDIPAVWGAGLAQRSEPERSGGERSGASPAPQTAPPNDVPGASEVSPQADHSGLVAQAEIGQTEIPQAEIAQNAEVAEAEVARDAVVVQEVAEADVAQEVEAAWRDSSDGSQTPPLSGHGRRQGRGRRLVKKDEPKALAMAPEQRLLLLDIWQRSGLPAEDFGALVGLSKHTLYGWKKRFDAEGPAGLMDRPRGGPKGSRMPELTKRTILMLKESNPQWGCQRISDMLLRGPALPASPSAVAQVLHEAGYELEEIPTRPHPPQV